MNAADLSIGLNLMIEKEVDYHQLTFLETYLKRKLWDMGSILDLDTEQWKGRKEELGLQLAKQELENLEMKDELKTKSTILYYSILLNAIAFGILTVVFM